MSVSVIILAAGKGTRMNSDLAKVLHPLAGVPLLQHAMAAASAIEPEQMIVVTGHQADAVAEAARAIDENVIIAHQAEQLGTGHAVQVAAPFLAGQSERVIVLYGDTPFVTAETMQALVNAPKNLTILGFEAADPGRYGRLVTKGQDLERIVEWKDASDEERAITLCNSGLLSAPTDALRTLADQLSDNNQAKEFYLTDIPALARQSGLSVGIITCDEAETLGINTLGELADAEKTWQNHRRRELLDTGVIMQSPDTVHLSFDTEIGRGAVIEPNVVFSTGVTVETGAHIRAFSHLEGVHVSRGAIVGPYARLRPGTELAEDVRVGNFVEIKNATLAEGAKVNHLSYIGDAEVGRNTNIGAGTITCNYDGVMKHRTDIGEDAFIGSNTMLVAPVRIGDEAMTGSGSVITSDVPDKALALARAEQVVRPGMARKLIDLLRAKKARKGGK